MNFTAGIFPSCILGHRAQPKKSKLSNYIILISTSNKSLAVSFKSVLKCIVVNKNFAVLIGLKECLI